MTDRHEWLAQHLKLIAFPTEPQMGIEQEWWSNIAGKPPETSVRKPFRREDSGPFEDVSLSLEIDPFRIGWTISPKLDPDDIPVEFPTLGSFNSRSSWLVTAMTRWLSICPPVKRLAFAGSLVMLVDSKEESYRRLNSYLPQVDVDPNSSDFMYRVNRPRDSRTGINGLRINRLCTWVAVKITFGLNAVSAGTGEVKEFPIRNEQDACVVELDINTVPEMLTSELPHDSLAEIFTELVDIGREVAVKGDSK